METRYLNLSTDLLFLMMALTLLIRRSPNKSSNNFLGLLFLLIAAYCKVINVHFHTVFTNNISHLSYYLPLDTLLLMLMSPCMYYYVLSLLNPPMKLFRWRTLLHGLPLLPCVVFNVLFSYRPVEERVNWLIHDFYSGSTEMLFINVILYLQLTFYLIISYKAIQNQLKISVYVEKNGFRTNISWVRLFLLINIVFILASLPLCFLINNEQTSLWIGHIAMNLDFIFLFIIAAFRIGMLEPEKMEEKKIPYQINEELAVSYWKTLRENMDAYKPYLDENCSLRSVAAGTKISESQLSKILHAHGGISFADFINEYRLKEAVIDLKDKSKYRKTIDTIAIDCGFGSRSSFYRAFDKAYHTTPTDYRKLHDENPEA